MWEPLDPFEWIILGAVGLFVLKQFGGFGFISTHSDGPQPVDPSEDRLTPVKEEEPLDLLQDEYRKKVCEFFREQIIYAVNLSINTGDMQFTKARALMAECASEVSRLIGDDNAKTTPKPPQPKEESGAADA